MLRIPSSALTMFLLMSSACGQISDSQRLRNDPDISKLAAITRADHSAIFFDGPSGCGYARDGEVRGLGLERRGQEPDVHFCVEFAVSHDGFRIVYFDGAGSAGRGLIVLRDLKTGAEKMLTMVSDTPSFLAWSWDDRKVAYNEARDVVEIRVADGSKQILGHLSRWNDGKPPVAVSELHAIEWLHYRSGFVLDANPCLPTKPPGECVFQNQVVLWSPDNSKVLAMGCCAALSPSADQIAYIGHDDKLLLIDPDGSDHGSVATLPSVSLLFPFLKESPWSRIVWSPNGDRLWLTTIIDEGGNTNVYLVDIKGRHKKKILKRTLVKLIDWRM